MIRKIVISAIITVTLATVTAAYASPDLSALPNYELLARNVKLEAGCGTDEEQQAVIQVARNRLASGKWGETLYEVLSAPGQFSTWRSMSSAEPTEKEYRNVLAVLEAEEPPIPAYVMYYRGGRHHDWPEYREYAKIGGTYFGFMRGDGP